jgi:putative NADPH-quinone reductase
MTGECQEDMESFYHSNLLIERSKFHLETAAEAGHEVARNTLRELEFDHLRNNDRAINNSFFSVMDNDMKSLPKFKLSIS